ncbi:unnamed protein product [Clavelina lepadiformis]|uniref:Centrosomin N-terminal motif 1 domain-containing protein n=2 Tax=Clavelina lepadiformis TaxID=159417 RepID=A0ABP0F1P9_CLALP
MDSVLGEDPTLPLDFDLSVNMSQLPDMNTLGSPRTNNDKSHANNADVSRSSDPGPSYHTALNVVGGRISPINSRNMKDYGTQISELKKENFSLKLRIFYMEERMQERFDVCDQDQIWKTNIELKVECEGLRKELREKHGLLIKASNAMACIENQSPDEIQKARNEAEREVMELKEIMNEKVLAAESEVQAAQQDAEQIAQQALDLKKQLEDMKTENQSLLEDLQQTRKELGRFNEDAQPKLTDSLQNFEKDEILNKLKTQVLQLSTEVEDKDCTIAQLKNSLSSKQTLIELLNDEKEKLAAQHNNVEEWQLKLKETEALLEAAKQREGDSKTAYQELLHLQDEYQEHITEQQQRLDDFELATKQMSEELERHETEVMDLKAALKDSENAVEELTETMTAKAKDYEEKINKCTQDIKRRDKAIAGLTQVVRKKDEKINLLQEDISERDSKTQDLLNSIRKLEKPKSSPAKEALLHQLRQQLREADTALQDALDEKMNVDDEHERCLREFNLHTREKDRQLDRLNAQVTDYEDKVAALDGRIREKDKELQALATKHKNLLRDLQLKEEQRALAQREHDELLAQFEEEKKRFQELTKRVLRRSSGDFGSNSTLENFDTAEQIKNLEDKLKEKTKALREATAARDQALTDRDVARDELDEALKAHDDELERNRRTVGLREVEIRQLKDSLRNKEELMHDFENQLRFDLEKLSRQNVDLRSKLQSCEVELDRLRSRRSLHHSFESQDPASKSSHDETESEAQRELESLKHEVSELNRQLTDKDNQIRVLQDFGPPFNRDESTLDSDMMSSDYTQRGETNITYNSYLRQGRPKKRKHVKRKFAPHSHHVSCYDQISMTTSDDSCRQPARTSFNQPRPMNVENHIVNNTIDTTFGIPLDQTSYLSMPHGYHSNSDFDSEDDLAHLTLSDLKRLLHNARNQLSNAIRDLADVRKISNEQAESINQLNALLNEKAEEYDKLMKEYVKANDEKMSKESEVLGLLARIQDSQTNNKKPNQKSSDEYKNELFSEDESVLSTARSRHKSGDESDGMSSLSRKELRDVIANLKTKLNNAEKVNELLKRQVHTNKGSAAQDQSTLNPQLVIDLANEVERLKHSLNEEQLKNSSSDLGCNISPPKSSISVLKSKLPLPVENKGTHKVSDTLLRPELERARLLNRKLNERLAATEQTVRQQADKLNKCRAALREAGIASPPVSPIRAARSVPNLFRSSGVKGKQEEVTPESIDADAAKRQIRQRVRSASSDTNDASTQTKTNEDSGVGSISPKSEHRYNSLIQAQAKELSSLREKLRKSRETCRYLHTEMDMVTRYINSLLASASDHLDPSLMDSVNEELERSRNLVAKLKKNLSDNIEDNTQSEGDSDSSVLASPLPELKAVSKSQIQGLRNELNKKNSLIDELESKLKRHEANTRLLENQAELRPNSMNGYAPEKWLSVPNLLPLSATASSQGPVSSDVFRKTTPLSVDYRNQQDHGFLTPTSSHQSLRSASEDEMMMMHRDESSRLSTDLGLDNGHYASLPSVLDNEHSQHRASWPLHKHVVATDGSPRKSMPMYQRTIAVTEYLPPNTKAESSVHDDEQMQLLDQRRRLPTASDTEECTASFGGVWSAAVQTPQKVHNELLNTVKLKQSPNKSQVAMVESSCDEEASHQNHKLAREVDRLRRRLSDSKKINRSLKEELDLANRSLLRTRDSLVPSYQRSAHNNADLLAEHLNEIRGLRQRLEHSIATNDKLREKLESKLRETSTPARDHVSANIYVAAEDGDKHHQVKINQYKDLQKQLTAAENVNKALSERLKTEEKAHRAYQDAIKEMQSLQQHLADKSSQVDLLKRHIDQLQQELEKQNSLSSNLGDELASRDRELTQCKRQLEKMETEMKKIIGEEKKTKEAALRLSEDVHTARGQLNECNQLINSLKSEVALYEKVQKSQRKSRGSPSNPGSDLNLSELLEEIRSLRVQLERSIDANSALRRQLEAQLKSSRKREDPAHTTINIHHLSPQPKGRSPSPLGARRKLKLGPYVENDSVLMTPPASASSGGEEHPFHFDLNLSKASTERHRAHSNSSPTKHAEMKFSCEELESKPCYSPGGPYTMCKSEDFACLQKALANSGLIARKMSNQIVQKTKQPHRTSPEKKAFRDISNLVSNLCRNMDEGDQLLQMFWPIVLPYSFHEDGRTTSFSSSGVATGGHCSSSESALQSARRTGGATQSEYSIHSETDELRKEVGKLRRRLTTQDRLLQTTVERLHTTNRLKEGIEHAIVKQLSRTHDVLRKARGNLEANVHDGQPHKPLYTS